MIGGAHLRGSHSREGEWRRLWLLALLVAVAPSAFAKQKEADQLARMLGDILQVEAVHPDSVCPFIDRIEKARDASASREGRVVYTLALGRLYEERERQAHYAGETDYMERSYTCFVEAMRERELLAAMKAKDWVPVTRTGKGEKYFDGDMLNVAWRTMQASVSQAVRDTSKLLPACHDMTAFYLSRGNREAAFMIEKDSLASVRMAATEKEKALLDLTERYSDIRLCAEAWLELSRCEGLSSAARAAYLDKGIELYPKYERIKALRNERLSLSDPYLYLTDGPAEAYPGSTCQWRMKTRNVTAVELDGERHEIASPSAIDEAIDTLPWTAPAVPGLYTVALLPEVPVKTTQKIKPIEKTVMVTRLKMLYQSLPEGDYRILVVDSESGEPMQDVTLSLHDEGNDTVPYAVYKTDATGQAIIPGDGKQSLRIKPSTAEETAYSIQRLRHGNYWRAADEDSTLKVALFTDRAIYRPGQQMHVGGVVYRQKDWNADVERGRTVSLSLRDAAYKEVESRAVTCDSMGVFTTDFTLPTDYRQGSWSVRAETGSAATFRVEEYKRPTFTVTLADSLRVTADSLFLTGRAERYDGMPLRGARVTASLSAVAWPMGVGGEGTLRDTLNTDGEGRFTCRLRRDTLATGLRAQMDVLSGYGEQQSASAYYRIPWGKGTRQKQEEVDSAFLFRCQRDTFSVENPAIMSIYTNLSDVCLFYTLSANGTIVTDTLLRLTCDSLLIEVPYSESYGTGAVATFCFVKGGKVYTRTQNISLLRPDIRLRARWDTFRDKVTPGSRQEWRLTLHTPEGKPADASLMLTLYDASLDHLAPHSWNLQLSRTCRHFSVPYTTWGAYPGTGKEYCNYRQKRLTVNELLFSSLDDNLFARAPILYARAAGATMTLAAADTEVEPATYGTPNKGALLEEEEQEQTLPLREDFSEEAVFIPSLRTSAEGEASIVFTLPESLTTWHLLGVAHTSDMLTASLEEEIVANKLLMAQLRLPRFLRPGDEASLTATVTNSSPEPQAGKATLLITDAGSGTVIETFTVELSLAAGADTTYHFPLTAGEESVVCRWTAESETCGDGEQRLLPVLPSTEPVTNTLAFYAHKQGASTYNLSQLFPSDATGRRLTVEYTTHPEQYALQVLPRLAVAGSGNVLSLAAAYYAGQLARKLGVGIPDSSASYLGRIRELQGADGSFSWYPGMPGSAYLTREVGYLLSRLQALTGSCGDREMYERAAHYLLGEMPVPKQVSVYMLRNLYVVRNASLELTRNERQKVDSLLSMVKKMNKDEADVEALALSAIVLQHEGETRRARQMADAMLTRLARTDTAGVYIEFPQGPFTSIDRKLHIHVQLMEALQAIYPEAEELSGMRAYLLRQKRTQGWDTPVTSASAVFALMNNQPSPEPQAAGDLLTLSYDEGRQARDFVALADSAGYLRDSLVLETTADELRLQKFSSCESWGSVYADFSQPFSTVEAAATGMSVSEEYPGSLQAGQRIRVRHNLSLDQDYDYVTLSVPRPASLEPAEALSGYGWSDGLGYYREVGDRETLYHFCHIPRGHYQITEDFYVERAGLYHSGVATLHCEYAPEFSGHSADLSIPIR